MLPASHEWRSRWSSSYWAQSPVQLVPIPQTLGSREHNTSTPSNPNVPLFGKPPSHFRTGEIHEDRWQRDRISLLSFWVNVSKVTLEPMPLRQTVLEKTAFLGFPCKSHPPTSTYWLSASPREASHPGSGQCYMAVSQPRWHQREVTNNRGADTEAAEVSGVSCCQRASEARAAGSWHSEHPQQERSALLQTLLSPTGHEASLAGSLATGTRSRSEWWLLSSAGNALSPPLPLYWSL